MNLWVRLVCSRLWLDALAAANCVHNEVNSLLARDIAVGGDHGSDLLSVDTDVFVCGKAYLDWNAILTSIFERGLFHDSNFLTRLHHSNSNHWHRNVVSFCCVCCFMTDAAAAYVLQLAFKISFFFLVLRFLLLFFTSFREECGSRTGLNPTLLFLVQSL